jgi:hypothetical protein
MLNRNNDRPLAQFVPDDFLNGRRGVVIIIGKKIKKHRKENKI